MPTAKLMGSKLKQRPLSRYLKDYKHSQTRCCHCDKRLGRMVLVFRGKIMNKENTFADIEQRLHPNVWLNLQNELIALCRFCSQIYCSRHFGYFDIMAFKQYLLLQTEMSRSTVQEYVMRLQRLDKILFTGDELITEFDGATIQQQIISQLPGAGHINYLMALRKYAQYLAWQEII